MGFFISPTFLQTLYLYMNSYIQYTIGVIMKSNDEIFEGKTFQDLTKDIYDNQKNKKLQLDLLIQEIHGMIQTMDDAVMVAPLIKELFDVAIRNDEHLVKLAGVYQRILSKASTGDEESMLLSDSEKEDLINALQDDVDDIQRRSDKLKIEKEKTTPREIGKS